MTAQETLPLPDAHALAHSERLREQISAELQSSRGVIPFYRYMQLALYAPGLGYYLNHMPKLGRAGDFITAPEVSPLFGRCLAHSCASVLRQLDGGKILEFGAGSGALAVSLLDELAMLDALPDRYLILEVSASLRERQQARIEMLPDDCKKRVEFIDTLPADDDFVGVMVANEVLDAMPVERFCWDNSAANRSTHAVIKRLGVAESKGQFIWQTLNMPDELLAMVAHLYTHSGASWQGFYLSEYNPYLAAWMRALAASLRQGAILLIDYGYPRREYYHPQRSQGTLVGYYRHRMTDAVLRWPGLMDITAHVDFTAVAEAALANELQLSGYTTQTWFLMENGLENILQRLQTNSVQAQLAQANEVKRLTMPGEMGERFQVMALSRGLAQDPTGFSMRDLRFRL